jgi:hypothetical protein
VRCQIVVVHPAPDRPHAGQRPGQRHRDEPGVDQTTCHVGQQWGIEHVVERRDDGDLDIGIVPAQSASALETRETAAHNQHGRHRVIYTVDAGSQT